MVYDNYDGDEIDTNDDDDDDFGNNYGNSGQWEWHSECSQLPRDDTQWATHLVSVIMVTEWS